MGKTIFSKQTFKTANLVKDNKHYPLRNNEKLLSK